MSIYDYQGNATEEAYDINGNILNEAYSTAGTLIELEQEEWLNENQSDMVAWYVNQIGYDTDKAKRATLTNATRGVEFSLCDASTGESVYVGTIKNQIADFSDFTTVGTYYLKSGSVTSYQFEIADNNIWNSTVKQALDFMEQTRSDAWCVGGNAIGWRDGHQFSFELNSLVMQYISNPSYYESLPWGIYRIGETEYEDMRVQDCPDIIWLIKFGVRRYYERNVTDGYHLHALTKGQIAYFLWLYPNINQYVDAEWYQTIRDWTVNIWTDETCDLEWFATNGFADLGDINHNLLTTQDRIGDWKGNLPPGYAIVPNLMMHEVAKRDGLENPSQYLIAAFNNMNWLVNDIDLRQPGNTKGQRMSEHITFHSLTYMYKMYPNNCPPRTYEVIQKVTQCFLSRSNNIWDFRQYSTNVDTSGATTTQWTGAGNEPGNVAGFVAVALSLASVIENTTLKKRLKQMAMAAADNVFGRNPSGRCFDYTATDDYEGADLGWFAKFGESLGDTYSGPGVLTGVTGCLDGSPKESSYPYDPDADLGYTEGWVAFNSAWNMSLAYLSGENSEITDGIGIFAK